MFINIFIFVFRSINACIYYEHKSQGRLTKNSSYAAGGFHIDMYAYIQMHIYIYIYIYIGIYICKYKFVHSMHLYVYKYI